jgi:hypothetical protein
MDDLDLDYVLDISVKVLPELILALCLEQYQRLPGCELTSQSPDQTRS